MVDQPERFLWFTGTGWTAIGSIVSALSIAVLSVFNYLYLRAARKQADSAQQPFVAMHGEYDKEADVVVVHAVSQGSGPAIDVHAHLEFQPGAESGQSEYSIGCLAKEEKFWFRIGQDSSKLTSAILRYKSMSGKRWMTTVKLIGGLTIQTSVSEDANSTDPLESFG